MHISYLTLAGITLSTICASICPMNIGMEPMDMNGMHMAAQEMHHDMEATQACETCEKESEDIAFSNISLEVQQGSYLLSTALSPLARFPDATEIPKSKLFLVDAGPPPLSQSLIGTVILRV